MSSLNGASEERASAYEGLRATRLAKSYGGPLVLKHVDFSIDSSEIVAVIGENGAGKSTFAKIVAGAVQPESGELTIRGHRVEFRSPRDALRAGIAYIPPELAYLPDVSVAENILVGRSRHRVGVPSQLWFRDLASPDANWF